MPQSHRARLTIGLLFVFLTPPLYAQIHFAVMQQRPEDDQLFQLVTQIRKLQEQKQERQAIPLAERALSMAEKTQESGNRRSLDFTALTYPPLPGTMEEAAAIKTQLQNAQVLVQEQATEAAVKRLQSPRILHIATHRRSIREC